MHRNQGVIIKSLSIIVFLGCRNIYKHLKLQLMKLDLLKSKKIDLFTTAQARHEGISTNLLAHYLKKGLIERVSHGVYRIPNPGAGADLELLILETLKAVPHGIIGYKTALRFYGLTEEVSPNIALIVPSTNVPKRKLVDVELHSVKAQLYKKSVRKIRGILVTSLERTLVDLLRTGESLSSILKICREARAKRMQLSLTKIKMLGKAFRAKKKSLNLIEALL